MREMIKVLQQITRKYRVMKHKNIINCALRDNMPVETNREESIGMDQLLSSCLLLLDQQKTTILFLRLLNLQFLL